MNDRRSRAYAFRDAEEIIRRLSARRKSIAKWFAQRESLDRIVKMSVGGNTFRSFGGLPTRPSLVFREWASAALAGKTTTRLAKIESQTDYDNWLLEFSSSFRNKWQEQTRTSLPYGPSRKLPDLLLKHFVLWTDLNDELRGRLIEFLHVPLDSATLVGIKNCIADPEIPSDATMKFIVGPTMYNQIQQAIRTMTEKADVPAIYFDVLAWNSPRLRPAKNDGRIEGGKTDDRT